ncbi:MAG: GtrA family protein [Clostridia bacterium]|nr:GtrA family protein [Clostridia bacterium]
MKLKRISLGVTVAVLAVFSAVAYACLRLGFIWQEALCLTLVADVVAGCIVTVQRLWKYSAFASFLKYTLIGAATTVVNYVAYWLMAHPLRGLLGIGFNNAAWVGIATTASWLAAVIFSFFPNKAFAFDSHDWSKNVVLREGRTFFLSRVMTYVFDVVFMMIAVSFGMHDMVAKLFSNVVVVIGNFFTSRLIFKKK